MIVRSNSPVLKRSLTDLFTFLDPTSFVPGFHEIFAERHIVQASHVQLMFTMKQRATSVSRIRATKRL